MNPDTVEEVFITYLFAIYLAMMYSSYTHVYFVGQNTCTPDAQYRSTFSLNVGFLAKTEDLQHMLAH